MPVTLTDEQLRFVLEKVKQGYVWHIQQAFKKCWGQEGWERMVPDALDQVLAKLTREPAPASARCLGCEDRPFGALWSPNARPHTCEKAQPCAAPGEAGELAHEHVVGTDHCHPRLVIAECETINEKGYHDLANIEPGDVVRVYRRRAPQQGGGGR